MKKIIWTEWRGRHRCMHCYACVSVCPKKAIKFENEKLIWDENKCTHCGQCIDICPESILREVVI